MFQHTFRCSFIYIQTCRYSRVVAVNGTHARVVTNNKSRLIPSLGQTYCLIGARSDSFDFFINWKSDGKSQLATIFCVSSKVIVVDFAFRIQLPNTVREKREDDAETQREREVERAQVDGSVAVDGSVEVDGRVSVFSHSKRYTPSHFTY